MWSLLAAVAALAGCGDDAPATDTPTTDADAAIDAAPAGGGGEPPDAAVIDRPIDAAIDRPIDAATDSPDTGDAPGCVAPAWAPGTDTTVALRHGGLDRSYVVHVGRAVTAGRAAPLMLNFHGHRNSPSIQEGFSRMKAVADSEGFVVVYPQGVSASFNAGTCCEPASDDGVDDVGFARAIVDDVAAHVCVDRGRVYAAGFSNGGFMAHRLACEASDVFAAVGAVAATNVAPTCEPGRAVPVIAFHGDADTVVSYASGERAVKAWVVRDGCTGTPTRTAYGSSYCDRWSTCRDGAAVEWCTIKGLWHLWPGARAARPASPAIWAFLRDHALPR